MPDTKGKPGRADGRYAIIRANPHKPAEPCASDEKARLKDFNRSTPLVSGLKEASDGLLCAAVRFIREGEASSILSENKRTLESYRPFSISEIDLVAMDSPSFGNLAAALERYDAALRRLGKSDRNTSIGLLELEILALDADPRERSMAKRLVDDYLAYKAEGNIHTAFSEASKMIAILMDAGVDQTVSGRLVASAALRGTIMIWLPDLEGGPGFPEDEIPTKDGNILPMRLTPNK